MGQNLAPGPSSRYNMELTSTNVIGVLRQYAVCMVELSSGRIKSKQTMVHTVFKTSYVRNFLFLRGIPVRNFSRK